MSPDAPAYTFALPTELTAMSAQELHAGLVALAGAAGSDPADLPVALDASAVTDVDACGIQLLLALQALLGADGRTLRLLDPSDTLVSACRLMGVPGLAASGGAA